MTVQNRRRPVVNPPAHTSARLHARRKPQRPPQEWSHCGHAVDNPYIPPIWKILNVSIPFRRSRHSDFHFTSSAVEVIQHALGIQPKSSSQVTEAPSTARRVRSRTRTACLVKLEKRGA